MTKYVLIDGFNYYSFTSYKKALAFCAKNNISQSGFKAI